MAKDESGGRRGCRQFQHALPDLRSSTAAIFACSAMGRAGRGAGPRARLSDQMAVSGQLIEAVQAAERSARVQIEGAVVGIGGGAIESSNSRGVYEFGRPREVLADDMTYSVELASKVRLEEGRLLLQVLPQDFTVDGRAGYRNPRGVTCARLEANVHVITALAHDHNAAVSATMASGFGARKSEDAFSIQIMDTREQLQGYLKANLREVTRDTTSLMPSFGPGALSDADLDDLLGFPPRPRQRATRFEPRRGPPAFRFERTPLCVSPIRSSELMAALDRACPALAQEAAPAVTYQDLLQG